MSEPIITTTEELRDALSRITFVNTVLDFKWQFEYREVVIAPPAKTAWLVWATFERPDTGTGQIGRGKGREEIIYVGSELSYVVKTAWVLVELLVRHELMEGFRFDDTRIFNPHNSVLDLATLQRKKYVESLELEPPQ